MSVKLFVGGLSFSTSTEGLRAAFARFGAVDSAAVMTDRETGRSRGFGFVEMATTEEAERAMYAALERGLSFKLTMGNILTLTPPLTITREQMDEALDILDASLAEAGGSRG